MTDRQRKANMLPRLSACLMPAGLANDLTPQQFTDLIAYRVRDSPGVLGALTRPRSPHSWIIFLRPACQALQSAYISRQMAKCAARLREVVPWVGYALALPTERGRGGRPGQAARPLLAFSGSSGSKTAARGAQPGCRRGGRCPVGLLEFLPRPQSRSAAADRDPRGPFGSAEPHQGD